MKKNLLSLLLLIAAVLSVGFTSCNKNDNDDNLGKEDPPIVKPSDDPFMEVCQHVVEVAKSVDVFYDKCHSMEELNKHLEDIKKIDNVEDVYSTSTTMYVKIKDYGRISFSFYPTAEPVSRTQKAYQESLKSTTPHRVASQVELLPYMGNKMIAFVSQTQKNEKDIFGNTAIEDTRKLFKEYGYNVSPRVIAPNVNFFKEGIFDYDIVFLNTHGDYDPKLNLHEFMTSEEPDETNHDLTSETLFKYKNLSTDLVHFDYHYEIRNGVKKKIWYAVVSEKWIDKSTKQFSNYKKAIVMNTACHSMQGPIPETIDSISYNVAKIFTDRGAGAYFGYDEANVIGVYSGLILLRKLLTGVSLDNAYQSLPFNGRHEYCEVAPEYWADLKVYYNPTNMDIKQMRLHNPFENMTPEDTSTDDELKVTLMQKAHFFYDECYVWRDKSRTEGDFVYLENWDLPKDNPYRYGFFLSENENLQDAKVVNSEKIGTDRCFATNKNKAYFEYTLSSSPLAPASFALKPDTRYYYWPYFYDGLDYYVGDSNTFTTRKMKDTVDNDGEGELPDVPGTDL